MNGICTLTQPIHVTEGDFLEWQLQTSTGVGFHDDGQFIDALAEFVMNRYEGASRPQTRYLRLISGTLPTRTKRWYRRMFDHNGNYTCDFTSWVAECLALWVTSDLHGTLYSEGGRPHGTDPAYDILSVIMVDKKPTLVIEQVKNTEAALQSNCSLAVRKFKKLAAGDYDAELATHLEMMSERVSLDIDLMELMYSGQRQFRVTAVHGEDRSSMMILTTFASSLPGKKETRQACLIQVDWPRFWSALAKTVYEKLS